jgi:hypothetical protein
MLVSRTTGRVELHGAGDQASVGLANSERQRRDQTRVGDEGAVGVKVVRQDRARSAS